MDLYDQAQKNSQNSTGNDIPDLSVLMNHPNASDTSSESTDSTTNYAANTASTDTSSKQNQTQPPLPPSDDSPPGGETPTFSPPKKKMPGVLYAVLAVFLLTLPVIGYFVTRQGNIGDIRQFAAYSGQPCTTPGTFECTDNVRYQCVDGYWTEDGTCTSPNICDVPSRPPESDGYCDRSGPNVGNSSCTDKVEGSPCQIVAACGGGTGVCRVTIGSPPGAVSECQCVVGGGGNPPTPTPTPGCPNPNGSTHRECVGNTCQTVANAPGVCDNEENNTCDTDGQCSAGSPTNTPANPTATPVNPTNTPIVTQCQNIKIYRDRVLLTTDQYNTIKPGDILTFAVSGLNAEKARFTINNQTPIETSIKDSEDQFILTYTIPSVTVATQFTVQAEVYGTDGLWH